MFDDPAGFLYGLLALTGISLVLALRPGVSRSRRLLAGAVVVVVPVVGVLLAIVVRRLRGAGPATDPVDESREHRAALVDVARLGEAPPVLDRLLSTDQAERLEALVALSSTADASAVAVLRWAIEHGPSDVVLEAALTLEEIELRAEAEMIAARDALGSREDPALALAAADATTAPILQRIVDPSIAPALATQARELYERALRGAPERTIEIEEKIARLELAAGRPRAALGVLERLAQREGVDLAKITPLRDDAAFASRAFDVMSFTPAPLEVPPDLAARKLQTVLS